MANKQVLTDDEICDACPAANMRTIEQESLRCAPADCLVHPDFKRIAKAQAKKLLEYLIAEKECYLHSERILYTADIRYMLKQLEEKRNV